MCRRAYPLLWSRSAELCRGGPGKSNSRPGGPVRLQVRAVFRAEPHRVWAVLTDWERQADWMPDVAWIHVTGSERALGAALQARTKVMGLPLVTDHLAVDGWEPPRRLGVVHEGLVRG